MNQRLRRRHARVFTGLAVVLPVLFAAALLSRPDAGASALSGPLPSALAGAGVGSERAAGAEPSVVRDGDRLVFRLPLDWNEPDVLVYSSAEQPIEDELPPTAWLLGPLVGESGGSVEHAAGGAWAREQVTGFVLLYSLADARVLFSWPAEEIGT